MAQLAVPKVRPDGSFVVSAHFSYSGETQLVGIVEEYARAWLRAYGIWIRLWRSVSITEERLEFSSTFLSDPRVVTGPGGKEFSIVFQGRSLSSPWKDWVMRLVGDLTRVFPEVQFDRLQ